MRCLRQLALLVALAIPLGAAPILAQSPAHAQSPAERILLEKARTLESSGHIDLAAQSWQQILLSDPNNTEALAGLARWARFEGHDGEAAQYLDRLRAINPENPDIARAQAVMSRTEQTARLTAAARLAQNGHAEEAIKLYHQVFGDHPPDNWARAYYDAEASIPAARGDAIRGLRALVKRFPGDSDYAVDLGRILSYDARTRAEGEQLLRAYPQEAAAQAALRQALGWDSQNPAAIPEIRAYLKQHQDPQLAQELARTEQEQAKASHGLARTEAERAAYAALAANRLAEAENHFTALLAADAANPRALAGLGFLRMKQNNFGDAVRYFSQAQQHGLELAVVDQALATARFWSTMQQGTEALDGNHLQAAAYQFAAALQLRPSSPDALAGLAGVYMKGQQPGQAIAVYQKVLELRPDSEPGWRGLFLAQAQAGDPKAALATAQHFPAAMRPALQRDPEYLQALATAYIQLGEDEQAQAVLASALNLPFPDNGREMKAGTRMQYASLLAQDRRYAQAAGIYRDLLHDDPNNVSAWQGLAAMDHLAGHDADAVAVVEQMPPAVYDEALRDAGFLSMLAAVYQQQHHLDVAQTFLEQATRVDAANGTPVPIPLQLQIAAIDLKRSHPDQAYAIYRSILMQHPDRVDAWSGLMTALHQTGHDADALAQMEQIPPTVRRTLELNSDYQQTEAAIYAATGNTAAALGLIARVQAHYRAERRLPPADIDVQDAWLLYNAQDDRDLYRALMALGDRTDMTVEQRRAVQTIWASWSVRRAEQAMKNGDSRRAIAILTAAQQAFPGNPAVSKALAAGYLTVGQPKAAMAIYLTLDAGNATAGDYAAMVGAALATQNMKQAELWLREGLGKFPNDSQVLSSAARFEQARGDSSRAAAYWKASLNAMPKASATAELAQQLNQPEVNQARGSTGLAALLNPDAEQSAAVNPSSVALPGYRHPDAQSSAPYGPDPYSLGTAPVPEQAPQQVASSLPPASSILNQTNAQPKSETNAQTRAGSLAGDHHRRRPRPSNSTPPQPVERLGDYRPQAARNQPMSGGEPDNAVSSNNQSYASGGFANGAGSGGSISAEDEEAAGGSAQVHLSISSGPILQPQPQTEEAQIAPAPAQQLTLDTSASISQLQNARQQDEAMARAQQALAAAAHPADSSLIGAQYSAPQTQSDLSQYQQQIVPAPSDLYYVRPVSPLASSNEGSYAILGSPQPAAAGQQNGAASDQELMQEDLPPLRGAYTRPSVTQQPDPRRDAEMELANIEGGYSPWTGGTGVLSHRSGNPGYDQLSVFEAPVEGSAPLGGVARVTVVVRPSFLDAGQATTVPVLDAAGTPELLGSELKAPATPPAQQNDAGVGGELQLTSNTFGAAVGYTPSGFLVSNVIGRFRWKPANGPFTFSFTRDAVKDSQLSYSGLRDPASISATYPGNTWGGVISNAFQAQYAKGDAASGLYINGGGQAITGDHVESNTRIDGDAGAYWRVKAVPDVGNLTLGVNLFGMHYAHNLRYFTYGQGGYFSPQAYMLANLPFTWQGRYGLNWHYLVAGAFGLQAFQEDSSPYFPLDPTLQAAVGNLSYSSQETVGANYDFHGEAAYHVTDHWYVGGFVAFNNTRDYNNQVVGFFVRFLSRPQTPTELGPTGLFPWDGLRPHLVP